MVSAFIFTVVYTPVIGRSVCTTVMHIQNLEDNLMKLAFVFEREWSVNCLNPAFKICADALPPMTLVFCVRAQCELQMLAPLLRHLDVISVRVHYTGKAPLHDAAYTNPPPLPLSTSRKTAPPFGSLRQYATVWAVSYFALFWLLVRTRCLCTALPWFIGRCHCAPAIFHSVRWTRIRR